MLTLIQISLLCFYVGTAKETNYHKCGMESKDIHAERYDYPNIKEKTFTVIENIISSSGLPRSFLQSEFMVPKDRERRVVKGTKAKSLKNFPWIADIKWVGKDDDYQRICGAAIISEHFLLTAAHCFQNNNTDISALRLTVGEFDLLEPDQFEEVFEIGTIVTHPDFMLKDSFANDIALIKVKAKDGRGIQFSEDVQPICLPTEHTPQIENTYMLIAGLGLSRTEYDTLQNDSRYIQYAEVPIRNKSECNNFCGGVKYFGDNCLKAGQLCAGNISVGADTCIGDSGGPAVQNINGHFTLLGLTSFGEEDCGKYTPSIYTEVRYYLKWILSHMRALM